MKLGIVGLPNISVKSTLFNAITPADIAKLHSVQ